MAIRDAHGNALSVGNIVRSSDGRDLHLGKVSSLGLGGSVKVKFKHLPLPIGVRGNRLSIITEPLCRDCDQPLKEIKWNQAVHILICVNWKCALWRRPQGHKSAPLVLEES